MKYLIVGFGNIGHKRKAVLGKKCIGTVDPNPQVNPDYKNYKDVPLETFDTVILSVPQQDKYEQVQYFLGHGKNVLVEKPLIISRNQGKQLQKLAKKNKVIWYTSYNHRFEPNIAKAKRLLDENYVGKLYHARLVYSFGNIKERAGTWRETEYGVLEEVAPHPIDFVYFFGFNPAGFISISARKVESDMFDHWLFATSDKKVTVEISAVTWKNVFSIDVYGGKGSIHINGLRKWNGSELILRRRVLPSGVPKERRLLDVGTDLTWKKDVLYFENMIRRGKNSLESDIRSSYNLAQIAIGAKSKNKNGQRALFEKVLREW